MPGGLRMIAICWCIVWDAGPASPTVLSNKKNLDEGWVLSNGC